MQKKKIQETLDKIIKRDRIILDFNWQALTFRLLGCYGFGLDKIKPAFYIYMSIVRKDILPLRAGKNILGVLYEEHFQDARNSVHHSRSIIYRVPGRRSGG